MLLVSVVCLAINARAQTGGTGFNPFEGSLPHTPTPTPTISRRALAAVPNPPTDKNSVAQPSKSAETNRNSSVAVTSPTPQSNTRIMMFGNGVHMVRQGDNMIITAGSGRYVMSRREATQPPPSMMSRSPCGTVKHYLDTHPCSSFWRHLSLWWADNCL
jgi:hypothetical protein